MAKKPAAARRAQSRPARQPVPPEAPAPPPRITAEYRRLDTLVPWAGNPKEHDIGAIVSSMMEFGFRDPVAINQNNSEIEEGHGRVLALSEMKRQRMTPPRFIALDTDGEWMIPTLYFNDTELMQRRYALAHNRSQELGGG